MNWLHKFLKTSQIHDIDYKKHNLSSLLRAIYEITYKYQCIYKYNFKGHPKRLENIKKHMENTGKVVIEDFKNKLSPVFKYWLENHAILEPRKWAEKRLLNNSSDLDTRTPDLFYDYLEMEIHAVEKGRFSLSDFISNKIIDYMDQGKIPILRSYFNREKQKLIKSDPNYANIDFNEFFSRFGYDTVSLFKDFAKKGSFDELKIQIVQTIVFDAWFRYWKSQGIVQTRNNIEHAYSLLNNLDYKNFMKLLADINIIINVTHQSGHILDYMNYKDLANGEDYGVYDYEDTDTVLDTMSELTGLTNDSPLVQKWNKDLESVGFDIGHLKQNPDQILS